jgi:Cu-Zn family superoxide dismutase
VQLGRIADCVIRNANISKEQDMKNTLIVACAGVFIASAAHAVVADTSVSLQSKSGSNAAGTLKLTESAQGVRVIGLVSGLTPGTHGFHIHENGDCSAPDAKSAGEHFNPGGKKHGGLRSAERHGGDLGNIRADNSGNAKIDVTTKDVTLARGKSDSILGRALVVHAKADDGKSDPAGNSGDRVACGVIGN